MSNEPSPTNPYELVLADLKAKRAQIDQAISAIEAIRAGAVTSPIATPVVAGVAEGANPPFTNFVGMSIADASKRLLESRRSPLGTQEITAALRTGGVAFTGDTPANTVGSILHRQAKTVGDIISVGRGMWALASWYSNPGRFQKKKDGDNGEVTTEAEEAGGASDDVKADAAPAEVVSLH